MILRPATPDDAPTLALILGDWLRETGWMPILHTRGEDQGFLRHLIASCDVTVAEDASVLGFLARDGEDVRALYLAPEARGRGVGRALLDRAKAGREALGLWVFEANGRAVRFYDREGFRVTDRTDGSANEEKLPDLRMTWEAPR